MYDFRTQNAVGQKVEEAFEKLLTAAGIPWGKNPFTGTADPRRADYDHWLISPDGILTEEKGNPKAAESGNIALENDILDVSKAHYFLIAFPVQGGWHGRILHRYEIENLLKATIYRPGGRTYTYRRAEGGQKFPDGSRKISALVPIPDLLLKGVPVTDFIRQLTTSI